MSLDSSFFGRHPHAVAGPHVMSCHVVSWVFSGAPPFLILLRKVIAQLSQCTGARGEIDDPSRPHGGPHVQIAITDCGTVSARAETTLRHLNHSASPAHMLGR